MIGAIAGAVCAAGAPGPVLAAMADPACRIVGLTVTEKPSDTPCSLRRSNPSRLFPRKAALIFGAAGR